MLIALRGAFVQHWQHTARRSELLFNSLNQVALVVTLGWIASRGTDETAVSAVAVGIVLLVLWRAAVFQLGFLVVDANNAGTLEMEIIARAPVALLMLGKTLAAAAFYGALGVGAAVIVILVGGGLVGGGAPEVARAGWFAAGVPVAVVAVVSLAFLFGPLTFVVGGKPGFFNAIIPAGIVLSGFVHPVALLPAPFEVLARLLPTAWAMEALQFTLSGEAGAPRIVLGWAVAILLSAATLAFSAWLFAVAERRVRRVGLT